ncbi:MAG: Swt1 family HEPN domain-containing protein [Burkholderiales bacterium]|nr:Swt1 family HEPN domain-containing protein [Burkholderiales bacterium]
MAITNHERVGKAMELLRAGLAPFVEREIQAAAKAGTVRLEAVQRFAEDPLLGRKPIAQWDVAALLKLMSETWNEVFGKTLGRAERSLIQELRDWRNKWAHQEPFASRDAERAMDSMVRLLGAVSAKEADAVDRMMLELRRLTIEEQVRGEKRKAGGSLVEAAAAGSLKPWREVVTPHADVASGRYQQAEFAADLWQVHLGEGSDEYRHPVEFFRRTYLTESLKRLLVNAVERLSGKGGDPVVQLQTNFGGGKTHSMLALYHLFGGAAPGDLAGVDTVMAAAGVARLPAARRVVLVGNKISPGNPVTKPDGTVVRTLWGELAWQLGGKEAYARIAKDDERATSPGDALRALLREYGPCLVLIDEWVAYARQLHDAADLPAGSFETQFTFAQALTESAKLAGNCLLVISLPASDSPGSPHAQADDVEVGGIRGREALDRLRNVVGRVESSWRPASAEEGFEIVRRRLFEPLAGPEAFKQRDVTARAFAELYSTQAAEFPPECREPRLREPHPGRVSDPPRDLRSAVRGLVHARQVPAHPRGAAPHGGGDPHPVGEGRPQSADSALDDPHRRCARAVRADALPSDNWVPIIEKDVDGPSSLPLKIDAEVANLGKLSATRRVARTIYLGSAPTAAAAHRGLEDRRVEARLRDAGRVAGGVRRCAAAACGGGHLPLCRRAARYWYSSAAHRDQARRGPRRAVDARPGQGRG